MQQLLICIDNLYLQNGQTFTYYNYHQMINWLKTTNNTHTYTQHVIDAKIFRSTDVTTISSRYVCMSVLCLLNEVGMNEGKKIFSNLDSFRFIERKKKNFIFFF